MGHQLVYIHQLVADRVEHLVVCVLPDDLPSCRVEDGCTKTKSDQVKTNLHPNKLRSSGIREHVFDSPEVEFVARLMPAHRLAGA